LLYIDEEASREAGRQRAAELWPVWPQGSVSPGIVALGAAGGVLNDATAGLNWYLNPNMKIQFNYSATHRESGSGVGDGWIQSGGVRVAQDF